MLSARIVVSSLLGVALIGIDSQASESVQVRRLRHTSTNQATVRSGELIVQFREPADDTTAERALRKAGAERARKSAFAQRYLVNVRPGESTESMLAELRAMPEVDFAEPNGIVRAFQANTFQPNDRLFSFQWNLKLIGAERTWAIQKGSAQVAVAVLDTGIAFEDFGPFHRAPDWSGTTFLPGHDFVNDDDHPNDDEYHGTHVASTIAESTNNGEGLAGLAFGCALLPVKVLDAEGVGSLFVVAEGMDYATNYTHDGQHPVKVINLSLGGDFDSQTMARAVDRAIAAGVVVVAASGNDGAGTVSFPARLPSVIAVGAVDQQKRQAPYSNYGPELDVVAPGGDGDRDDDHNGYGDFVFQQMPDPDAVAAGRYDTFCYCGLEGTSMAAPHVSALAALLISQGITSPAAVKAAIESTAEDLGPPGRDDRFGHGLIRPSVALTGLGINR